MAESLIVVEQASRVYRKPGGEVRAVDGVDLVLSRGEFAALHGTSGAGKSTLLYLLGALGRPTSGRIIVEGEDLSRLSAPALALFRRRRLGFVFQSYCLVPTLTALENVMLPLWPARAAAGEARRRAAAVLEQVGMAGRAMHFPSELSGGEQQRVGIARALVMQPGIILADEPTSDLDRPNAEQIVGLLERLQQQGSTVVMATHDQRILSRATRKIGMEDGRVVSDTGGEPDQAEARP